MATKLNEGQSLNREIRVYGVEAPVNITITKDGLSARVKGKRNDVDVAWPQLFEKLAPPMSAKSYIHNAYEFLKLQAKKISKSS